jgi:hypothetical protein
MHAIKSMELKVIAEPGSDFSAVKVINYLSMH